MKEVLIKVFEELNERIEAENLERNSTGAAPVLPVEIRVLGQMALLANEVVSKVLPLQRTNDLDATIHKTNQFVRVKLIDPESALVSKAVKAPEKNKLLIVDATASEVFPNLVQRIVDNDGNIEFFLKDE